MKKIVYFMLAAALAMSMLVMTACSGGVFSADASNEKLMVLTAENANEDQEITIGSLEVAEGDQITVTPNLEKGRVMVELIQAPEDQSMDELPDFDGEATLKGEIVAGGGMSGTVDPGSYYVRATVLEKANGTIEIKAEPAE